MKKYQIIYADPPWEYKNNRSSLRNIGRGSNNETKQGRLPYPSMSLENIESLNINPFLDKNCALFLWTTTPYLEKSFKVIKSWGFEYKTIAFCWLKTYQSRKPKTLEYYLKSVYGMNYYTKLNFELCLLAIKGKMTPISHRVSGQIIAPRKLHSQKPDEAKERIVELFGDLQRVELFARQKTEGWDVWGNEVESDIKLI